MVIVIYTEFVDYIAKARAAFAQNFEVEGGADCEAVAARAKASDVAAVVVDMRCAGSWSVLPLLDKLCVSEQKPVVILLGIAGDMVRQEVLARAYGSVLSSLPQNTLDAREMIKALLTRWPEIRAQIPETKQTCLESAKLHGFM